MSSIERTEINTSKTVSSADKGVLATKTQPMFDVHTPQDGRRELTDESCPLTSTHMPWHATKSSNTEAGATY